MFYFTELGQIAPELVFIKAVRDVAYVNDSTGIKLLSTSLGLILC